jgi:hypothetical protein
MRGLQEQMEQVVEHWLEDGDFTEAKEVIERIKRRS